MVYQPKGRGRVVSDDEDDEYDSHVDKKPMLERPSRPISPPDTTVTMATALPTDDLSDDESEPNNNDKPERILNTFTDKHTQEVFYEVKLQGKVKPELLSREELDGHFDWLVAQREYEQGLSRSGEQIPTEGHRKNSSEPAPISSQSLSSSELDFNANSDDEPLARRLMRANRELAQAASGEEISNLLRTSQPEQALAPTATMVSRSTTLEALSPHSTPRALTHGEGDNNVVLARRDSGSGLSIAPSHKHIDQGVPDVDDSDSSSVPADVIRTPPDYKPLRTNKAYHVDLNEANEPGLRIVGNEDELFVANLSTRSVGNGAVSDSTTPKDHSSFSKVTPVSDIIMSTDFTAKKQKQQLPTQKLTSKPSWPSLSIPTKRTSSSSPTKTAAERTPSRSPTKSATERTPLSSAKAKAVRRTSSGPVTAVVTPEAVRTDQRITARAETASHPAGKGSQQWSLGQQRRALQRSNREPVPDMGALVLVPATELSKQSAGVPTKVEPVSLKPAYTQPPVSSERALVAEHDTSGGLQSFLHRANASHYASSLPSEKAKAASCSPSKQAPNHTAKVNTGHVDADRDPRRRRPATAAERARSASPQKSDRRPIDRRRLDHGVTAQSGTRVRNYDKFQRGLSPPSQVVNRQSPTHSFSSTRNAKQDSNQISPPRGPRSQLRGDLYRPSYGPPSKPEADIAQVRGLEQKLKHELDNTPVACAFWLQNRCKHLADRCEFTHSHTGVTQNPYTRQRTFFTGTRKANNIRHESIQERARRMIIDGKNQPTAHSIDAKNSTVAEASAPAQPRTVQNKPGNVINDAKNQPAGPFVDATTITIAEASAPAQLGSHVNRAEQDFEVNEPTAVSIAELRSTTAGSSPLAEGDAIVERMFSVSDLDIEFLQLEGRVRTICQLAVMHLRDKEVAQSLLDRPQVHTARSLQAQTFHKICATSKACSTELPAGIVTGWKLSTGKKPVPDLVKPGKIMFIELPNAVLAFATPNDQTLGAMNMPKFPVNPRVIFRFFNPLRSTAQPETNPLSCLRLLPMLDGALFRFLQSSKAPSGVYVLSLAPEQEGAKEIADLVKSVHGIVSVLKDISEYKSTDRMLMIYSPHDWTKLLGLNINAKFRPGILGVEPDDQGVLHSKVMFPHGKEAVLLTMDVIKDDPNAATDIMSTFRVNEGAKRKHKVPYRRLIVPVGLGDWLHKQVCACSSEKAEPWMKLWTEYRLLLPARDEHTGASGKHEPDEEALVVFSKDVYFPDYIDRWEEDSNAASVQMCQSFARWALEKKYEFQGFIVLWPKVKARAASGKHELMVQKPTEMKGMPLINFVGGDDWADQMKKKIEQKKNQG